MQEITEQTSPCRSLAISLLISERRILTKVKDYCEKRVEKVKTKQNLAPISGTAAPEPMSVTEIDDEDEEDLEIVEEKPKKDMTEKVIESTAKEKTEELNEVKDSQSNEQNGVNELVDDLGDVKVEN